MASMATAQPAPSSVAPVPPCQVSKWPPEHDDLRLEFLVDAGDLGDDVVPGGSSAVKRAWISTSRTTGTFFWRMRTMRLYCSVAMAIAGTGISAPFVRDPPLETKTVPNLPRPGSMRTPAPSALSIFAACWTCWRAIMSCICGLWGRRTPGSGASRSFSRSRPASREAIGSKEISEVLLALQEDDGVLELAFVLVEVGDGLGLDQDGRPLEHAVRARGPGFRIADDGHVLGLGHGGVVLQELPAAAERPVGLHGGVGQARVSLALPTTHSPASTYWGESGSRGA